MAYTLFRYAHLIICPTRSFDMPTYRCALHVISICPPDNVPYTLPTWPSMRRCIIQVTVGTLKRFVDLPSMLKFSSESISCTGCSKISAIVVLYQTGFHHDECSHYYSALKIVKNSRKLKRHSFTNFILQTKTNRINYSSSTIPASFTFKNFSKSFSNVKYRKNGA